MRCLSGPVLRVSGNPSPADVFLEESFSPHSVPCKSSVGNRQCTSVSGAGDRPQSPCTNPVSLWYDGYTDHNRYPCASYGVSFVNETPSIMVPGRRHVKKDQPKTSEGHTNNKSKSEQKPDTLREQAEKLLSEGKAPMSQQDAEKVIHELGVHQMELEMQNEELRQCRVFASVCSPIRRGDVPRGPGPEQGAP